MECTQNFSGQQAVFSVDFWTPSHKVSPRIPRALLMRRQESTLKAGLTALLLCSVSPAVAGGLYVTEIVTPTAVGTAGVGNVVNNIAADSAYTNPAGMTGLKSDAFVVGAQLLVPNNRFDSSVAEAGGSDGGNAGVAAAIPGLFLVKVPTERLRLGFSVTAPLGAGLDFGKNFVGRYGGYEAQLAGIALSGSIGYKVTDKLSLGAGISALYTKLDEKLALRQARAGSDGKIKIEKADDWSPQGFLGLTYQATDKLLLGFTYLTESDVNLDGGLKFENVKRPLINEVTSRIDKVRIDTDLAQAFTVGLKYKVRDNLTLFANADYEDWSEASGTQVKIKTEGGRSRIVTSDVDWKDTWHVGAALAYEFRKDRYLFLGASYDSSPLDDSDRTAILPLDEQVRLSIGYGQEGLKRGRIDYNVGLTYLYAGNGKVDQVEQDVRFKGKFETNNFFFLGANLQYRF